MFPLVVMIRELKKPPHLDFKALGVPDSADSCSNGRRFSWIGLGCQSLYKLGQIQRSSAAVSHTKALCTISVAWDGTIVVLVDKVRQLVQVRVQARQDL